MKVENGEPRLRDPVRLDEGKNGSQKLDGGAQAPSYSFIGDQGRMTGRGWRIADRGLSEGRRGAPVIRYWESVIGYGPAFARGYGVAGAKTEVGGRK